MNALKKINARASQLKKANKSLSHKDAIKKASADYRAGRLGSSAPRAKAPAKKRKAAARKAPVKRRAVKRKKVAGFLKRTRSEDTLSQIRREKDQLHIAEAKVWQMQNVKKRGWSAQQKRVHNSDLDYWRKSKAVHKKNITNLKRLV